MANVIANRVKETSTTTGTGNITVAGAVTGYRAFSTACAVGDTFIYCIEHQTANEWEIGYGTYSAANTITRTLFLDSSTGAAVSFSAGTKNVFITVAEAKGNFVSGLGSVDMNLTAAGTDQSTALAITGAVNFVSTVAAGTGVRLPNAVSGSIITVINHGANTLLVYPATGETVEGLAANTGLALYPGQLYRCACGTNGAWDGVDINIYDDENNCIIISGHSSKPSAPPTNSIRLFGRSLGGKILPAFIGPSGVDSSLQPHMARNGWAEWKSAGTGTTISAIGAAALTATGTATAATYATTSLHTRCARVDNLVTTAATTAVAGFRIATNAYRTTDGFHMIFRVAPATGGTVATRRFYTGMSTSTAAPTDVDPSTLTNSAGVGYAGGTDTNWQVYFGGTAVAKVNTGIAIPSTDRPGPYTVVVFAPPGAAYIGVQLIDESTGTSFSTTTSTSTNMIASTTACGPRGYHSVGGTSSVVGFTLFNGYMETDN